MPILQLSESVNPCLENMNGCYWRNHTHIICMCRHVCERDFLESRRKGWTWWRNTGFNFQPIEKKIFRTSDPARVSREIVFETKAINCCLSGCCSRHISKYAKYFSGHTCLWSTVQVSQSVNTHRVNWLYLMCLNLKHKPNIKKKWYWKKYVNVIRI